MILFEKTTIYWLNHSRESSMFSNTNFYGILGKLSKIQTTFGDKRRDRRYTNSFGFYGYNIIKSFE